MESISRSAFASFCPVLEKVKCYTCRVTMTEAAANDCGDTYLDLHDFSAENASFRRRLLLVYTYSAFATFTVEPRIYC
jgi:hypothetical protein